MLGYHKKIFHNNINKKKKDRRVVEKNKPPTCSIGLLEEDEKVNTVANYVIAYCSIISI